MSNKQEETREEVEVTVGDLYGQGEGRYALTYTTRRTGDLPKGTPITFSMKYWKEREEPGKGQVLLLADLRRFAKGMRAFEARPVAFTSNKQ